MNRSRIAAQVGLICLIMAASESASYAADCYLGPERQYSDEHNFRILLNNTCGGIVSQWINLKFSGSNPPSNELRTAEPCKKTPVTSTLDDRYVEVEPGAIIYSPGARSRVCLKSRAKT